MTKHTQKHGHKKPYPTLVSSVLPAKRVLGEILTKRGGGGVLLIILGADVLFFSVL